MKVGRNTSAAIRQFWFGGEPPQSNMKLWFRKDPAVDAQIREQFGAAVEEALNGKQLIIYIRVCLFFLFLLGGCGGG